MEKNGELKIKEVPTGKTANLEDQSCPCCSTSLAQDGCPDCGLSVLQIFSGDVGDDWACSKHDKQGKR